MAKKSDSLAKEKSTMKLAVRSVQFKNITAEEDSYNASRISPATMKPASITVWFKTIKAEEEFQI